MSVNTGSRGGGQSARAKSDYIAREGKYEKDAGELEHVEHGNMPAWAQDDPRVYWSAADENERSNGSLFKEIEVALPVELSADERRELAQQFAAHLTESEKLPYTLAIHKGKRENPEPGEKDNPHAHLMISERANDGIERSAEKWFKRANTKTPALGGAKKSRTMMDKTWLPQVRAEWAQMANRALEKAGREERIDGRSLVEQRAEAERDGDQARAAELDRQPDVHMGPRLHEALKHIDHDGTPGDALKPYEDVREVNDAARQEDAALQRISWLERELETLAEKIRVWGEYVERARQETAERIRELMRPRTPQPDRDEGRSR